MLLHYFTVALRSMGRQKLYTIVNILGLAIGLAAFLLIFLFVKDELMYDKFHTKQDRIYRVLERIDLEGQGEHSSSCPFPVATTLQTDFPQLLDGIVRFFNFQDDVHTLKYNNITFNEKGVFFADSNVFKVFDFKLLEGDTKTALNNPGSIVINKQLAEKYFGTEKAVGKMMKYDGGYDVMVTGVMDQVPTQSHLQFQALASLTSVAQPGMLGPNFEKEWVWNPCWTYVLLKDGVSKEEFEKQFAAYVQKYYPNHLKKQVTHSLQPLASIHLHSHLDYEMAPNNDYANIWIFSLAGVFILLIACINFMNMATARSAMRAKEVGIRKVVGAHRSLLIRQFVAESLLTTVFAAMLALVVVELLLPFFNSIAGKQLEFRVVADPWFVTAVVVTVLTTAFLSGMYPAFILSAFQPVEVLKGKMRANGNISLRKALVVLQFAISVSLIIGSVVVYKQLQMMQAANLGFDKEHILMLPVRPPMAQSFEPIMEDILKSRHVKNVTTMNDVLGVKHNTHEYFYEGMNPNIEWLYIPALMVNERFVETMGMEIVAGRNFSKDFPRDDSLAVIINEAMAAQVGWTAKEAIGKRFNSRNSPSERVVGVVKDFNAITLKKPIGPFVLDMLNVGGRRFWTRYIAVKVSTDDIPAAIADIKKSWGTFIKDYPFDYFFLNEELDKQYKSQQNLSYLMACFTVLAIFIACLGLFALASFMTEQRTKEIGIRKVLGAEVGSIISLLSKEFLVPIIIANLLAWPISWLVLHNWLKGFAYRTSLTWYVFICASLLIIIIAQLTVVVKTWRVALNNPVKSLKYE